MLKCDITTRLLLPPPSPQGLNEIKKKRNECIVIYGIAVLEKIQSKRHHTLLV